jgi:hypothetical protein
LPTNPFFSSVVRLTIFRVVPVVLDEESLPSLDEDELPEEEEVGVCCFGIVGSGIK